MKENIPYDLIARYLANECSDKEKKLLETWIKTDDKNAEVYNQIKCTWVDSYTEKYQPDVDVALEKINSTIKLEKSAKVFYLNSWLQIASVIIIVFGLAGIILVKNYNPSIEVITAKDQRLLQVILPDGSGIEMNAESRLTYPKKFRGHTREIEFEGEAYFKISSDKSKPFIIYSENAVTKVLGTEFNLKTEKEEKTVQITVTEGLVSFSNKVSEIKVAAGEAAELQIENGEFIKSTIKDKNFLSWKTGKLVFENQTFGSAVGALSKYYNKEIIIPDSQLSNEIFSASFDSLTLEQTLETIELIMDIEIEKSDNSIILKPKG